MRYGGLRITDGWRYCAQDVQGRIADATACRPDEEGKGWGVGLAQTAGLLPSAVV